MRGKTVEENKRKMAEISRELASLGSGGAALGGIERDLGNAVSVHVCVREREREREREDLMVTCS